MRRSTQNCELTAQEQRKLVEALSGLDTKEIGRILQDFATPARVARLGVVLGARLDSVTVLMDSPHDPHNGAAVLRSCDAFGVQRLHIIERNEPFLASRQVARGSERWVDVHTYARTADAASTLEQRGFELVATHPEGELLPDDLAKIPRLAVVLGNERDGIHPELRAACKRSVRIPMRGFAESLNVSVTAAILLEHATAGRAGDLSDDERAHLYARALIFTVQKSVAILRAKGMEFTLPPDDGGFDPRGQKKRRPPSG
jgi:tRNA (guanosine-2'-O-)-methyltransferase